MADGRPSVGVIGLGRLGRAVVDACAAAGLPVVLTASRRTGWRAEGAPDVVVDASGPEVFAEVRDYCATGRAALVECVSNLSPRQQDELTELARHVPVVRATNLAIGHHLQKTLVRRAAELVTCGPFEPTASVRERHPRTKAHRPSASAVELAGAWTTAVPEICAERAGLPVSDHDVTLSWGAETLTVSHSVGSFAAAAEGAVAAARWVTGRSPGLLTVQAMYDELLTGGKEPRR